MELYGEKVSHQTFGDGKIVECKSDYVSVLFDESKLEKKFVYPSAFGTFLKLDNKLLLKDVIAEIEAEKKKIGYQEKLASTLKAIDDEALRLKKIKPKTSSRTKKVPPESIIIS